MSVNRVGHEGQKDAGLEFWGHSFVCDPIGVVLAEAGQGEETLVVELRSGATGRGASRLAVPA